MVKAGSWCSRDLASCFISCTRLIQQTHVCQVLYQYKENVITVSVLRFNCMQIKIVHAGCVNGVQDSLLVVAQALYLDFSSDSHCLHAIVHLLCGVE